jgi:acetyl esterase/lipase
MENERTSRRNRYFWQVSTGFTALAALVAASVNRSRKVSKVSPELRSLAMIAMPAVQPLLIPLMRRMTRHRISRTTAPPGVVVTEQWVRPSSGDLDLRVVILQRSGHHGTDKRPALLWLHGGGYVIGTPEIDFALLARILDAANIVILSVDYRLAPRDPFPAPLNDAVTALHWAIDQSEALGIDRHRIAVGGNSAGGGLAAALAQRARDEGISLTFQLLMYPMLDDRTACRTDHEGRGELIWNPRNNRYGWRSYLGHAPGTDRTALHAAPMRTKQLAGLPPAWIGVGSLDLFYREDVAYAERLHEAKVPCELHVVADAPHAFDRFNFDTETSRHFHASMIAALVLSYTEDKD